MIHRTQYLARLGLLVGILALLAFTPSVADELQAPQQVIQSVSDQLQHNLHDKSFTKNFPQVVRFVNGIIAPHVDFDKIAPLVLGSHWKSATPDEQQRFEQEFQTLLVRIYSRAFVEYHDWTIRYLPLEMVDGVTKAIVKTEVLQPHQQPVQVDYRMFQSNGDWKVYDIIIAGVSLVTNYRSTFDNDINNKGSVSSVIADIAKHNKEALQ